MKRFPIGFWNYPSIDEMDADEVKVWADCGMSVTMSPTLPVREDAIEKLKKMLDECQKRDIQLIIRDPRLHWNGAAENPDGYREKLRVSMADFGFHPATYGFFVGDEPVTEKQFRDCEAALRIQREEAPNLTGFLNFVPYWHGIENDLFGGKSFENWARGFVEKSGCKMISYDCYSQLNPEESGTDGYFINLHKFTKATKAVGIPLWTTLLSIGHFRYRVPTEDDLRWQLYSAVASGVKGIHWFFFYGSNYRNYRGAPINQYGEKTPLYHAMSLLHRNFHDEYGSLMMGLTLKKCYHIEKAYGEYELFPKNANRHIVNAFSDHHVPGILSFFEDDTGKEYIALVNNSPFESDLFKLELMQGVKHIFNVRKNGSDETDMRLNHHDAFFEEKDGCVLSGVWLAPGQMEVFRIEE